MDRKVIWTEEAGRHLEEIEAYVTRTSSPGRAALVVARIHAAVTRIREFPYLGRSIDSMMRAVLAPPYRIDYSVTDDAVVIIAVRHTARGEEDPHTVHEPEAAYVTAGADLLA